MKKKILILCSILFLTYCLFQIRNPIQEVSRMSVPPAQVVIDIGHGGADPGKVGINGALEKDINLAIGIRLADYLATAGYQVTMTRESDVSLADPSASNQKLSDFKNRTALINASAPYAVISIHQNSYPEGSVKGAQVFYANNTESKNLASFIQEQCRRILDPENHRQIKTNSDYYLFRHTTCPIVIVECGFLSNYQEANLLTSEEYQDKTAWALYMGTVQFLKTLE